MSSECECAQMRSKAPHTSKAPQFSRYQKLDCRRKYRVTQRRRWSGDGTRVRPQDLSKVTLTSGYILGIKGAFNQNRMLFMTRLSERRQRACESRTVENNISISASPELSLESFCRTGVIQWRFPTQACGRPGHGAYSAPHRPAAL